MLAHAATPADLRRSIARLDPGGPLHLQLDAELGAGRPRPWWSSQREHWLGWLAEYGGPGAYGRANGDRSAAFVYGHFQCPPGLAWLAEAAGVDPALVAAGCDAARASGPSYAARCGAFRRVVPWGDGGAGAHGAGFTPALTRAAHDPLVRPLDPRMRTASRTLSFASNSAPRTASRPATRDLDRLPALVFIAASW